LTPDYFDIIVVTSLYDYFNFLSLITYCFKRMFTTIAGSMISNQHVKINLFIWAGGWILEESS